jgi:hypothetical protein
MIGELEATFEGPLGDALVEHVAGLLLVVGLFFSLLLLSSEGPRDHWQYISF